MATNLKFLRNLILMMLALAYFSNCESENEEYITPRDPDKAPKASVDRFSDLTGTLMKRSQDTSLPGPNEAIDFDQGPFISQGFGPTGNVVRYYNFDVQPTTPVPVYVFFKKRESDPLPGQLNVFRHKPGDVGYSDFWQMYKVIVPDDYVANTATSYERIEERDFTVEITDDIVNCPIVPGGSTADLRWGSGDSSLHPAWYKDQVVYYFHFPEKSLEITSEGKVPTSAIYVTFNINPDESNPESGPASGAKTEPGSNQTHNVVATVPTDEGYSPFWQVHVYDNNDFESVSDLTTAAAANILNDNAANVNCPVVYEE